MRNTIKAKIGYEVRRLKSKPDTVRVYDGDNFIFEGEMRTYEDYVDELVNAGNEAARKCEVFTTVKGNQFVYWRDEEADWDLITKIN